MNEDDFDRHFRTTTRIALTVWAATAVIGIALTVVAIWAVIRVVQHFT